MNVIKARFERALANAGLSKINDRQRRAIFAKGGRPGAEDAGGEPAFSGSGGGGPSVTEEQQRHVMTLPASLPDLPRIMVTSTAPGGRDVTPGATYSYRKPYPDQAPPYRPPEVPARPAAQSPSKPTAQQHQTGMQDPTQHIKDIFKIYTDAAKNPASSGMLLAPRPPTKKK